MSEQIHHIPSTALKLIEWICPEHLREEIEGDLLQRYDRDLNPSDRLPTGKAGSKRSDGSLRRRAKRKLLWNALCYFRLGILLRKNNSINSSGISIRPFLAQLDFGRLNNLTGWVVFTIALLTYSLTLEETASYWDCSEFIATSYKLQVPHPPGAPLFLLLGRMFSFLALGDVTKVAYAINMMSALSSALTVLFLYWSIVLIGRKMIVASKNSVEETKWLLFSAGTVGALAYAFSDSFWFSAVEAEVYAMSSLFTAFVFWAMLKWENATDESRANRWLILIAYVVGLSVGVHLLNLLTLPALALIYYFKKYKATFWGLALTILISVISVLFINDFIIFGLPSLARYFEIFFVNTLGFFFGSGAIAFMILLVTLLVLAVRYTHQRQRPALNTFSLAFTFILIGYCSYAVMIIRSNFHPLINESAPTDVMSFVRYVKREQYPSWPLLFGPYFTSQPVGYHYTGVNYVKGKDKYQVRDQKFELEYAPGDQTILPRVWNPDSKEDYKNLLGLAEGQKPTFAQNISYMLQHQMGTMYLRYFMWNFAGRTSDELGADWFRPNEWFKKLPASLASNKARNNFFMIPFILGLVGMFYHFTRDTKASAVIALLFVMLGIAIVVYLNSPPSEPRERDYIYVGSYYAFAVWIGLAVIGISETLNKTIKHRKLAWAAASIIGMAAPIIMVSKGWNDHDRSDRFFQVDGAQNSLNSCDKNGIMFTGGDNDTFPLWYAQETENCRTDLRVLVLSYCSADWYIDQTTRAAYQSAPFPYTLSPADYSESGPNNYLTYQDLKIKSIDANEYLDLLAKQYTPLRSDGHNVVPSRIITLNVNKKDVLARGIIPKDMEPLAVDQMELKLKGSSLGKSDLLLIDLLATTKWTRPIYLNPTSLSQVNIDLTPYIVQEGNVYRILPVKNPTPDRGFLVNTEKSYDLMVNKFKYRGLDDPNIYYTNDYQIQVYNQRSNLNTLAEALLDKGENEKAANVLNLSLDKMPGNVIPYDPSVADTVSLLFRVGDRKKATEVAEIVGNQAIETAAFLIGDSSSVSYELRKNLFLLSSMQRSLFENNETAIAQKFNDEHEHLMELLQDRQVSRSN